MLDLLASELGIDRVELRRRNMVTREEMPYRSGLEDLDTGKPVVYGEGDYPATFESALERIDYESLRDEVERRRADGETIGIGVAAFIEMGNPGIFEQARVVAEPDGTFSIHVGVASVGQGVQTVLSQIAADVLSVPLDRVQVSHHDTDVVPEGQGAFSSRATVWGGQAIAGAIRDMVKGARKAGAKRLGVPMTKVVCEGGAIRTADGKAGEVTLAELGASGEFRYEPGEGSHVLMGANVALVRVDRDSGGVEILRYAISYEVGKAINPLTLEGQVRGAAVQGLGGALLEEFAYDRDGQPLSTSFMDYALPTAAEMPDFEVVLVELGEAAPGDPLAGAKGAGEGGIIATAATMANGISDALGGDAGSFTFLPLTPERVALGTDSDGADDPPAPPFVR
jgi:carbon-monoxide dehydrogenase large subunit